MGIEKTTEHESGYFEDEEDDEGEVRGRKKQHSGAVRSESDLSSNNNDCDVTVSDCSEDNVSYNEKPRSKGKTLSKIKFGLVDNFVHKSSFGGDKNFLV